MEVNDSMENWLSPILPAEGSWKRCGSWRDTLTTELVQVPDRASGMLIKTVVASSPLMYPRSFFSSHRQLVGTTKNWNQLNLFPGYEYSWQTTDGLSLDELNIRGLFSAEKLFEIIAIIEGTGIELNSRWDVVVIFLKT